LSLGVTCYIDLTHLLSGGTELAFTLDGLLLRTLSLFTGESVMNLLKYVFTIIISLSLFATANLFAADDKMVSATSIMAEIVIGLHHYPSNDDKEKLRGLSADAATSVNEKIIAQALLNVKHGVSDADRPKLEAITKDSTATGAERTLATVLLKMKHKPSNSDISVLHHITK